MWAVLTGRALAEERAAQQRAARHFDRLLRQISVQDGRRTG